MRDHYKWAMLCKFMEFLIWKCLVTKFNKSDTNGTALCIASFFKKCFALVREYSAENYFKGGTSLKKGWEPLLYSKL